MSKNVKLLKENIEDSMYSIKYYMENPYLADSYQEFMDNQTGSILRVGLPINLMKMTPQEFVDEYSKSINTMDAEEFTRILLVNRATLLQSFTRDELIEMVEYYEELGDVVNGVRIKAK